jgi:hypothetical protein
VQQCWEEQADTAAQAPSDGGLINRQEQQAQQGGQGISRWRRGRDLWRAVHADQGLERRQVKERGKGAKVAVQFGRHSWVQRAAQLVVMGCNAQAPRCRADARLARSSCW